MEIKLRKLSLRWRPCRRCDGCGRSFYANPGPVLRHKLWKRIARRHRDCLCDLCVRAALGRPFIAYDLVPCPWNWEWNNPFCDHPTWKGPLLMRHRQRIFIEETTCHSQTNSLIIYSQGR